MEYCKTDDYILYLGKMQDELKNIPDNSIDSIVTDPPYELGFMGKSWDSTGVAFQTSTWKECLRVLKPGGHMLAFGGSRTFHRIACAIEDAGFEIRDTIMWLYGSAMPKSMNIGLAIDKKNGIESEIIGYEDGTMPDFRDVGKKQKQLGGEDKLTFGQVENAERKQQPIYKCHNQWGGWGTCLKPAYESIIMARKPVVGTILDTIEEYGTGGINIDDCRVPLESDYQYKETNRKARDDSATWSTKSCGFDSTKNTSASANPKGRFPANVILTYDETDEQEVCGGMPNSRSGNGVQPHNNNNATSMFNDDDKSQANSNYNDNGSAARYFYCAKASKKDREDGLEYIEATSDFAKGNGLGMVCEFCGAPQLRPELCHCEVKSWVLPKRKNMHPSVKPSDLMQYLIRLVTPYGGTVLDPFMGSGSTGKAAMLENRERNSHYHFIGVEMTDEYLPICKARIDWGCGYVPEVVIENNVQKVVIQKKEEKVELF